MNTVCVPATYSVHYLYAMPFFLYSSRKTKLTVCVYHPAHGMQICIENELQSFHLYDDCCMSNRTKWLNFAFAFILYFTHRQINSKSIKLVYYSWCAFTLFKRSIVVAMMSKLCELRKRKLSIKFTYIVLSLIQFHLFILFISFSLSQIDVWFDRATMAPQNLLINFFHQFRSKWNEKNRTHANFNCNCT